MNEPHPLGFELVLTSDAEKLHQRVCGISETGPPAWPQGVGGGRYERREVTPPALRPPRVDFGSIPRPSRAAVT